ncbi:MAG: N-6 DNA methylase [Bacteroidales bacterium]|nr:N-6 DNA methylase [Bacteroidales bacterium]
MSPLEQEKAAKEFSEAWEGKGYEKGQSQAFWLSLLRDVYGVDHPEEYIKFEDQVHLDSTSFIDARILQTKVLIEQKNISRDLNASYKQSDGSSLTPFDQAKKYILESPVSEHPRWVITCNFKSFLVYDMEQPAGLPQEIKLENLSKEYYRLQFLVNPSGHGPEVEMALSMQAGEIVGKIYDAFYNQYHDMTSDHSRHSLNVLCVRLVFCLYAENSGLFGSYGVFYQYLASYRTNEMRRALVDLFKVLDTPEVERDPYLVEDNDLLASFPYVNGGLFSDEDIEIPVFTEDLRDLLLEQASARFNWSEISPTIFGAVFESTLNPETKRNGGMHYTSIENIHKVIDPLFLDDLKKELDEICKIPVDNTRNKKLDSFQDKIASLTFLDPACGSGNFLTETYLSLRKLENKILEDRVESGKKHGRMAGQIYMGGEGYTPIKVGLEQFYGIEINDFAVTVAKTALWIAENQMMKETQSLVSQNLEFLPLNTNANIVHANALWEDWAQFNSGNDISFIVGNPPFVGGMFMSDAQNKDLRHAVGDKTPGVGRMDYVSGWFYHAANYIQGRKTSCAFVATNSIVQGQQANDVWKPLISNKNLKINFAYRTFRWDSEANIPAHVHCVIVGFSTYENGTKFLFTENGEAQTVKHINSHLEAKDDWFVQTEDSPLCDVPPMYFGSMPRDGGGFILDEEEKECLIAKEPLSAQWIRQYVGSDDFLNDKHRYCLWMVGADPEEIAKCPAVLEKIEYVKKFRLASKAAATRKYAKSPTLFVQIAQPDCDYLLVPATSSGRRGYLPMGFVSKDVIASNAVFIIPNADLYHFGVLTSCVHMAWLRALGGRLKSDYRYARDIVYNTFPWPEPTEGQKKKIEQTARVILEAREKYPNTTLSEMYNSDKDIYSDLDKAHEENDKAVMSAYGWGSGDDAYKSEEVCVTELMKLYQRHTEKDV